MSDMAFRCGQNIHIIKCEMENKHSSKRSKCVQLYKYEAQNSKKSLKKTKFEVEKKLNMKSTEIKIELENV